MKEILAMGIFLMTLIIITISGCVHFFKGSKNKDSFQKEQGIREFIIVGACSSIWLISLVCWLV